MGQGIPCADCDEAAPLFGDDYASDSGMISALGMGSARIDCFQFTRTVGQDVPDARLERSAWTSQVIAPDLIRLV
ncbi:hypothetical protein CN140_26110 [Sinorhizobium meliloti]|nr:hypothetical protein CN203_33440 [Sinorhizobium meliloti]RVL77419.1 hypothetical protein CN140_26110 [Sinorhizobium meliloti]RVN49487.1 hypothetical protein CN108_31805 [Sinorhizobium meliloti]RVO49372.1 hypothetical protein CN092_28840 [Sinorhizobium meliloti]